MNHKELEAEIGRNYLKSLSGIETPQNIAWHEEIACRNYLKSLSGIETWSTLLSAAPLRSQLP